MQAPTVYNPSAECALPGANTILSLAMTALRLAGPNAVQSVPAPAPADPTERIITLDELSWHDHAKDCWIVIYDRVYNITEFLDEHPGGADVLLEHAGRDATIAFRGAGHSRHAILALARYQIGVLPQHECLFRKPGGIRLSNLPE